MAMNSFEKPHVVAVPFPALGHAIPFVDFAKLLASHGLTITCVTTAGNASRLQQQLAHAISSSLDIRLLVLPTPVVEGLAEGLESFAQVPTEQGALILELVAKLEDSFNHWLEDQLGKDYQQGAGPPVCVMNDIILGWSMEVPQKHNIPTVVFNTYGAFGLSVMHSAWLSASHNTLEGGRGESFVLSLDLPNPMRLNKHEIDPFFFEPFMVAFLERLQSVNESCGMLVNTFELLEAEYVQHLRNRTGKKVWSVGPLLPPNILNGAVKTSARGKMADISEKELLHWLDSQSPSSVAYISFGSQTFLSEEQSKALASGLEASGQPFIWAIKASPKVKSLLSDRPLDLPRMYLPEGFNDRTKNKGLVIWGWVPQLVILSHPSVGAFMSHCGWNSMLESVTFGVPLITWPMFIDQHFNSKLAVKLGIGIQVCEHRTGVPEKQRVEDSVTCVLRGDQGKEMKRVADKLKDLARKAVADGGSSNANLEDFVSDMHILYMARKGVVCAGSSKA